MAFAFPRAWLLALLGAVSLLLAGCGEQELYTKLDEREANELIAALQTADIAATKTQGGKEGYAVSVAQGDFARAVSVLRAQGLPRPKYDTLGTVFQKGSFGNDPTEAHARYIYARQQELTGALRKIDGVVDASVQLSMPQADRLADEPQPASASVLIKYRPGVDLQSRASDIKALVANGVEGMAYDRVNLSLFRAEELAAPAPRGFAEGLSARWLLLPLALLLGVLGVLGLRRRARTPHKLIPRER